MRTRIKQTFSYQLKQTRQLLLEIMSNLAFAAV